MGNDCRQIKHIAAGVCAMIIQMGRLALTLPVPHFYSAQVGQRRIAISLSVCLSASISLEPLDRPSRNFLYGSPVVVARSSFGGVALRHAFPVLWMTSCLAVMGRMAMRERLNLWPTTPSGVAIPGRTLVSLNALFLTVAKISLPKGS